MTLRALPRLWRDRAGSAAVESALTLPILFVLILGAVEVGRMAWTKAALTYAVQDAARCAAVRKTTCADATQTKAFAAERVTALNIPSSAFAYAEPACGRQVTAAVTHGFILYKLAPSAPAITARACHA